MGRESDLKRLLKQLQDQTGNMEDDLQTTRALLDAVRNESVSDDVSSTISGVQAEAQAELDRLTEALERSEAEASQLRQINEQLQQAHSDYDYRIKVMDARIEHLNLELERKEGIIAELEPVSDKPFDKLGKTWHGFRNVSPLYSELGQIQPLHPSLVDGVEVIERGKKKVKKRKKIK
jgi:uncharacterized protein with von Willebrand factor type A (vWA) domain